MYKILVADDENALRMLIAGTLEIGNYDVIQAEDGITALELVKSDRPDLVILDVMMPGMNGYDVCRSIKTNPDISSTKVLILTARSQRSDREAAWEAMADYYLAKPFSPKDLLAMVEEIFA